MAAAPVHQETLDTDARGTCTQGPVTPPQEDGTSLLLVTTAWGGLESVVVSEISQREKGEHGTSLLCSV